MSEFLDTFQRQLQAEALRYQAGHDIFCRLCSHILDCGDAVGTDVHSRKTGELVTTAITCAKCYDEKVKPSLAGLAQQQKFSEGFMIEILDGREFQKEGLLK